MHIVFKKIPALAKLFYLIGFCVLGTAMVLFFYFSSSLEPIRLQQIFIGGGIIVALGSVINTIYQFKSSNNKEE